jgi:hypothetical protein
MPESGLEELHAFPVCGVANRTDHAHAILFVFVLDGPRLHHRRHAIDPIDAHILEDLDHVDVDEVNAKLHARNVTLLHLLNNGVGELRDLHDRSRTRRTLDPGKRVLDVFFGNPGVVPLELEADVTLFEYHRCVVSAQQGVAQAWLEFAPTGRECCSDITNVFVIHQQHCSKAVRFHALASPIQAVSAHSVPVDALLPIHPHCAKVCHKSIL